jgi:hypothetical protein
MEGLAHGWKQFFLKWPAEVERRGIVVTSFNEQVPFSGFAIGEAMLLLERATPDTVGARKIILGWEQIAAVKITEVVKTKSFQAAGFVDSKPPKGG